MKPRTLRRLELMAAAASMKLREEIVRHNTVLGQCDYQKGVLAAYRGRLKETWRHGGVVSAAQAVRAEVFVAASDQAGGNITAEAERAKAMLDEALQALARNQERRRGLARARETAEVEDERERERKLELAANWRRTGNERSKEND